MPLLKHLPEKSFRPFEYAGRRNSQLAICCISAPTGRSLLGAWLVLETSALKRATRLPEEALHWVVYYEAAVERGAWRPTPHKGKYYWVHQARMYETTEPDLTQQDVLALVNEAANRRRLQLEKAHALQAMTEDLSAKKQRKPIPQDVKVAVWQRDGGRCVECDSNEALEFDHIIPLSMGGANTLRNLQLLCEVCNRRKGATLG